jgi:hypothetical protein
MTFRIRLVNPLWSILLSFLLIAMFLCLSFLYGDKLSEMVLYILLLLVIIGSLSISTLIFSRIKDVEINEGSIIVGKSIIIPIDKIELCRTGKSFLIDGLMIKMKNHKRYYFHTLILFNKNPDFKLFENKLFSKTIDNHLIPVETKYDYLRKSKFFRFTSTILLMTVTVLIILTFLGIHKVETIKLFYWSLLSLGLFISTRK